VTAAALLAAAALAACGDDEDAGEPAGSAQLTGHVVRVSDGDTIRVRLSSGREERVRYIGVDTPETAKPGAAAECFADRAAAFNARLVADREVRLERDVEERDRYGRLLAYVYAGDTLVNGELVRRGYAQPLTVPPNVRHAERFRRLADEARRARSGLWNACAS
jgi:micrococcal nuclease